MNAYPVPNALPETPAAEQTTAVPDTAEALAHLAIIMDGNRRWAAARGLPASAGHRAGAEALKNLMPALGESDLSTVSVYGFSQLNWQRSRGEIARLFALMRRSIDELAERCIDEALCVEFLGRRDRLPRSLVKGMERIENRTASFHRTLRIALDYSGQEAIAMAAARLQEQAKERVQHTADNPADLGEALQSLQQSRAIRGDRVDLMIRTGGEQRLSDFLIWECAHAELRFEPCMWPDFSAEHLQAAIDDFYGTDRRQGR